MSPIIILIRRTILNMHGIMLVCFVLVVLPHVSLAVDNGLGLRPPMGWRNWWSMFGNVDQDKMQHSMEKLSERKRYLEGNPETAVSFADLGYNRVGLDDFWYDSPTLLILFLSNFTH